MNLEDKLIQQLKLKKTEKAIEYEEKYEKIIVTYHDGGTKEFTPHYWAIFEDRVSKIAKKMKYIELNPKPKKSCWVKRIIKKIF